MRGGGVVKAVCGRGEAGFGLGGKGGHGEARAGRAGDVSIETRSDLPCRKP